MEVGDDGKGASYPALYMRRTLHKEGEIFGFGGLGLLKKVVVAVSRKA